MGSPKLLQAQRHQDLCTSCKEVDFTATFSEDEIVPPTGRSILSLGRRSRKFHCDMCRFFLALSPTYKRKYKVHVRLFDQIKQSTGKEDVMRATNVPRTCFLSVLRENTRLEYDSSIEEEIAQAGVVVYLPTNFSCISNAPVSVINATTVDFKLLAIMMQTCQSSHSLCTTVNVQTSLTYIYLINCVDHTVVRQSPSQSYLALSYVWGESTPKMTSQASHKMNWPEGSFSFSEAPLTVQDAIRVVLYLGRTYLWVDRYCINQSEGLEKSMMLRNMDQIYENAEATIVAMYGDKDKDGLPGVSVIPRRQPSIWTRDGTLLSSCPPISTLIQTSKWATRGWTYQEARLSRRCLFFTEYQVYMVCRETTRSEAVPSPAGTCLISSLLNGSRIDASLLGPRTSIANGFCRDRLAFTQRTLTYESDILDAFRGILNHSHFITFWGVPITPAKAAMHPNTGLALGLLWTRKPQWAAQRHLLSTQEVTRVRRLNFPTWSWTSVSSEIFNEGYGEKSVLGSYLAADASVDNKSDTYIRFWVYLNGVPVPLDEIVPKQQSNIIAEDSPLLLVEGEIVRLTLTRGKQPYRIRDYEHLSLSFWAAFDLDQDAGANQNSAQDENENLDEDALILIDWNDSQRKSKKRFVLMLLRWVRSNRAERKGLVSEYRKEYDIEELNKIPRTRKKFILQ